MSHKYESFDKEELFKIIDKQEQELKTKKYGLVWDNEKEPEQVVLDCESNLPILKEVVEKDIKIEESDYNILIEGDNYHALTCLSYTHKGKVDVIYIDPPYNTGNRSWKYNNDYVEKDDGYKHSKWLNFMDKRLILSKNLLKQDGVICVTIDNYEVHNIRLVMERIFSDREIVITVIEHNFRGRSKNNFALTHEYAIWALPKDRETITRKKEISDEIKRNLRRTGQGSRRHESPTLFYGIEVNKNTLEIVSVTDPIKDGEPLPVSTNPNYEYVLPIDNNGLERRWYYSPSTVMEQCKIGSVWAKVLRGKIEIHYRKPGKPKRRKSVWSGKLFDSSTYGSELLTEIIGENDFPYPKSIHAVKECIDSASANKNAIVLDFFSGSGTTGQAVLELNKEDGGKRKFILCTNNEVGDKRETEFNQLYSHKKSEDINYTKIHKKEWDEWCEKYGICSSITYPRIKNVILGYKYKGKVKTLLYEKKLTFLDVKNFDEIMNDVALVVEENTQSYDELDKTIDENTIKVLGIKLVDGIKEGIASNLKYYKTDLIPVKRIDQIDDNQRQQLTNKAGQMIAIKENTFEEIEHNEWYQIFENQSTGCKTAIYFREDMEKLEELIEKVSFCQTVLYVYSYGRIDKKLYRYLSKNITIEDIPEPIIEIYKQINLRFKEGN